MTRLGGVAIGAILVLALSLVVQSEASWPEILIVAVIAAAAIAICLAIVAGPAGPKAGGRQLDS